jgi:uncharacterized BrkB/YihY/UPF0761 family membrane protein
MREDRVKISRSAQCFASIEDQSFVGLSTAFHEVFRVKQTRSITVRLSLVFLILLLLVIALGGFSIGSLSYFNGVSAQVRDRWLPSTGALGIT